ncbi:helix-turn-helix domain-containing protein [Nocardia sp. NPDC058519]|uniref:helix-turn-helix domain-containing protein n=1 Tax=Nocardia sp. NPDC058519 TaxID=3346535 RepID=UPI0036461DB2
MSTREPIIEVKRHFIAEAQFVRVRNSWVRGKLSPRGKAVMMYLMSHKDGYHPTKAEMAADMGMHKSAVSGGITDAEDCNYLVRQPVHGRSGKVVNVVYHVSDHEFEPQEREEWSRPIHVKGSPEGRKSTYVPRSENDLPSPLADARRSENDLSEGRKTTYIEDQEKTIHNIGVQPPVDQSSMFSEPDGSDAEKELSPREIVDDIIQIARANFIQPKDLLLYWKQVGGVGKPSDSSDIEKLSKLKVRVEHRASM